VQGRFSEGRGECRGTCSGECLGDGLDWAASLSPGFATGVEVVRAANNPRRKACKSPRSPHRTDPLATHFQSTLARYAWNVEAD